MQARIGGDEVNANCAPELPEVITVPQSVPARPARLRLLKRMSQATTEVAPSGGDHEVQQEVSRRHGTWVEMIVEDSDNDDEERDNPVESDDDSDCVLDALQRDLEVDVASVCPAAADAPHFGRVAVQATQRQVSESVTKKTRLPVSPPTPRTTQLDGESAIASRRSATATSEDTPNMSQSLLQHEIFVGPPVARNPAENDSESDSTERMREVPRRRRLVLLPRISGVGVDQEDPESIASQAAPRADAVPQRRALSQGLRSLDGVDLTDVFTRRALVMRSVPRVLPCKKHHKHNRTVTRRACHGRGNYSCCCHECFCGDLQEVVWFRNGIWKVDCVYSWQASGQSCCSKVRCIGRSSSFRVDVNMAKSRRAARAVRQVELGELSAGRQALEGESVAPGTLRTLRALTDPGRRPEIPREPLLPVLSHHVPRARVVLDKELRTTNLRKSRRDAAGGPSGMTAEHLKGLFESEDDSSLLAELANSLAQAYVPSDIVRALRLGRITALQKPDNGCGALLSESSFADWWRALWRSNFRSKPKKRRLLASTHWPRRVRVRGTRHPSIDGPRRQRHSCVCGWGGGFRPHFTESDALRSDGHEGR